MYISNVKPIEVRLRETQKDPMMARVVYNILSNDGVVIATKRCEINITGYTRELLTVILNEFSKTIEHNDRINESHELYADMINPRQIASADKVLNNEDRKKKLSTPHITLPEGVKKQFEKLQAKELKGSGQSE